MGLSVSRTIWLRDDLLEIKRSKVFAARWEIEAIFKRIPKGIDYYIVTYTLDSKGPLIVIKRRIMVVVNVKTNEDAGACFLPKSWDGRRVKRKIIVPIFEIIEE